MKGSANSFRLLKSGHTPASRNGARQAVTTAGHRPGKQKNARYVLRGKTGIVLSIPAGSSTRILQPGPAEAAGVVAAAVTEAVKVAVAMSALEGVVEQVEGALAMAEVGVGTLGVVGDKELTKGVWGMAAARGQVGGAK